MVRKVIKRAASSRKMVMFKRIHKPKYESYRWITVIQGINFDTNSNIASVIVNSNVIPGAEYAYYSSNYRTAAIIKANMTFMPNLAVLNSQSQTAFTGPLMIAPYHGTYDGTTLTNGRVGVLPGVKFYNIGSTYNPVVNWYRSGEEDFDTTSALAGRRLDETYGGFLVWCDGTGFTSGFFAGTCVIRYKIGFKNDKYTS